LYAVFRGANARATMTFGVANARCPFGYPRGYENPAGEKKGWVGSIPWSRIPIFIPVPAVARSAPQRSGAWMICGVRSSSAR
jgi:hypothetical protein